MTTPASSQPGRRPTWRRKLLFLSGGLLVLLVVMYFVVTSSAFFKGVILPRAGKALGGEVTAAEAAISPFSQVTLRQLAFKTTGPEPLVQAEEVILRYRLFAILGGTLKVDEVTISSPIVNIVENADGSRNLDPLTKKETKTSTGQPAPKPSTSKPPQIDLKNFALKNATVRHTRHLKDGGREVSELTGVNITLDQLKNGQPGKLTMAAAFKMTRPTNDVLEAKSSGNIEFTLGADLLPTALKVKVEQEILRAEGSLRELAGVRTGLACDITVNTANETAQVQTFTLDGTQNQKPLLRGSLSKPMTLAWGKNAAATGDSTFELTLSDFDLAAWKPLLGEAVSAGQLSARVNLLSEQAGNQLKLVVTSQIANLGVKLGDKPLTQAALALKLNGQVNDLKKVSVSDYRIDLTQQGQPALTVTGSAGYDGTVFHLQTQIEAVMARLMGSGPATPLTAGVKLDGTFTNQVLDLHQLQVAFAPTPRAPKNGLTAAGRLDLSNPATTKGRLTVKSDTLDLTQLYEAFAGEKSAATTSAGTANSPAPTPADNVEPKPVTLPLQLTAEANLGQVYLREVNLQNCQVTAHVDGGKVTLDPCRLTMNGAPVNATVDLNLGVKGYTYALDLKMDRVPLQPIADTFSPDTRGQYQGLILARAQIKGAGVTVASLRKNLGGEAGFSLTNANIQLMGPKTRKLVVPIATLLRIEAITKSPLNWLDARIELGGGNIKLSRFAVQSAAFEATTAGVIPVAEVLTNSPLNLPVEFALHRSLAEKASLLPPNTPPDAPYAMLPKFVTVKGTVGDPKSDLNEMALGGLLLKSGVGLAEKLGVKVDPKTGSLLQGVGNLMTGQKPATNTHPASTNRPSTNPPARLNPLDLFRK